MAGSGGSNSETRQLRPRDGLFPVPEMEEAKHGSHFSFVWQRLMEHCYVQGAMLGAGARGTPLPHTMCVWCGGGGDSS